MGLLTPEVSGQLHCVYDVPYRFWNKREIKSSAFDWIKGWSAPAKLDWYTRTHWWGSGLLSSRH